ncbi:DMT family transporter [Caldovatus aquaticus]|uniref:DMT family transporter n=1 Tax=Caldovatus aquaticus TaxID=2865671 RepID=A0ABS7EZW6_9PROT|nr:DMT family transporter [Caldovatus aquaticus]MBW8268774.1 DMT family transporter [Caldovatus aquaticus]
MRSAFALLGVAVVLFGGTWPVTKAAVVAGATPLWFGLSRAGLAALVAAAVLAAARRLRWPARQDWRVVVPIGLLQIGGFFALAHLALLVVSAGRTAVLANVVTYWLIPLSMLVLGERVSARRWAAAGLGLAGVGVLAGPWAVDWGSARALLGHGMLMLAALSWSVAIVVTRRFPPRRPMLELLPWCFGVGTLALAPLALAVEPGGGIPAAAWPHMLAVGAVAAPVGTWCVIEVGRRLPGAVSSVGFLLVPAVGVVLSTLWLGEPLGWDVLAGGALIVASVVLAARG